MPASHVAVGVGAIVAGRRAAAMALSLACALLAAWPAVAETEPLPTATLEIGIVNVASDEGVLVVALLDSAEQYAAGDEFFRSDPSVPIRDGKASVTFERVPYGTYAVKVFHDENSNGELDTNFVGFPTEGFGFSNDAMGSFGPPDFEDAAFVVRTERLRIEITAKRTRSPGALR